MLYLSIFTINFVFLIDLHPPGVFSNFKQEVALGKEGDIPHFKLNARSDMDLLSRFTSLGCDVVVGNYSSGLDGTTQDSKGQF